MTPAELLILALGLPACIPVVLGLAYLPSGLRRLRREGLRLSESLKREVAPVVDGRSAAFAALRREAARAREAQTLRRLQSTPIEALKAFGATNVRWTALRQGGYHSVADLNGVGSGRLQALQGVGPTTAGRVVSATTQAVLAERSEPLASLSPTLTVENQQIVRAAQDFLIVRDTLGDTPERLSAAMGPVEAAVADLNRQTRFLAWVRGGWLPWAGQGAAAARDRLAAEIESVRSSEVYREAEAKQADVARRREQGDDAVIARDLRARFADYASVTEAAARSLNQGMQPGPQRHHGSAPGANAENVSLAGLGQSVSPSWDRQVPKEIAEAVERTPLELGGLRLTLRGYQEFGARFVLHQRRVLLGDEMGLGKTIQALTVMHHLSRDSATRFLVVAPASLLTNWEREAKDRTNLPVWPMRAPGREDAMAGWATHGGLGLVSYETCSRAGFLHQLLGQHNASLDFLVVDEAHFAKNPAAGRSRAVAVLAERAARVCLMTGTPLENRVAELSALLRIVRPDLAQVGAKAVGRPSEHKTRRFHRDIAGAYLRRNREDVLGELPERIDKHEWVDLGPADVQAYRSAVLSRNFMAMRRAVSIGGGREAAKVERVLDLLDEYRESGRKVLVFSFFLDVLGTLRSHLPGVLGTLAGAVPQGERTEVIDRFRAHDGHGILLCQISTGGLGLNLQTASAVILMEPQWKPTAEEQAIGRVHRMGQTETVVVHRILARESVDERMLELLSGKREEFEAYARPSAIRDASPAAVEARFSEAIIDAELQRLQASA